MTVAVEDEALASMAQQDDVLAVESHALEAAVELDGVGKPEGEPFHDGLLGKEPQGHKHESHPAQKLFKCGQRAENV